MEECARNMACDYNGEIVSQENYREPMNKMGEIGQSAINNIRPVKKRNKLKPIKKYEEADKEYREFASQTEAIVFADKTLGVKLNKRSSFDAPKELQTNGNNPTSAELFKRMWGINNKNCVRMIPVIDNKWCVYWRPSLIKNE